MEIIKKYTDEKLSNDILLNEEQALSAFDLFVEGSTPLVIKHKLFLPINKIKNLEVRLVEVREMIERIVKHEARLVREEGHWTETTEDIPSEYIVDVEEVLCPVPQTLSKLKERSLELVLKDYNATEPLFATDDMNTMVTALNYVIEEIIKHSNEANDATYEWWKDKVTGG